MFLMKEVQMMKGKLFLDIHVLQVIPPSCLNRDYTGA